MKKKDNILKKILNKLWENKLYILIMIIYILLSYKVLLSHEPWRDEAQAWLIGRDLSIFGMIKQMYYEGHPCLWSLILSIFAKTGFPYFTMNIVSYSIMWITALVILKKAPFNIVGKLALVFSSPFMYSYSVFARNYSLIPLAITLIAINYKNRHQKPIQYILSILFLAWTHVIMLGMVGILLIMFYFEELIQNRKTNTKSEKKKVYISLAIIIIGLLLFVIPIGLGAMGNNLVQIGSKKSKFVVSRMIAYFIFNKNSKFYTLIVFFMFLIYVFYETVYYRKNMIILYVSIFFQAVVYYYVYGVSDQRVQSLIFIIMFIVWIQKESSPKINYPEKFYKNVLSTIMVVFLILFTNGIYNQIKTDLNGLYSDSKNIADYMKKNIETNSVIITLNMPNTSAIIPYIEENQKLSFYGADINDTFTYVTWNYVYRDYNSEQIKAMVEKMNNRKNIYVLCANSCSRLHELIDSKYMYNVYKTKNASVQEKYDLYKVDNKKRKNLCS